MPTQNSRDHGHPIVANCHARDRSGVRASGVRAAEWADLPHVSPGEIAWALHQAGFDARLAGPDNLAIVRDGIEVGYVPLHESIHPGTLRAVLRSLGVAVEDFVAYLSEPLL
jgi:hypothetical protein